MRVSIAELAVNVRPYGEVGNYLYQQLIDFNFEITEKYIPAMKGKMLKEGRDISQLDLDGWPKGEMWFRRFSDSRFTVR